MTSPADAAFVRHKSRHAVTWALVNLQRLAGRPCAMTMGRPLEGRTAIIVGAGYPLVRNGEHLRAAQERGAVILGTNSSDPVMRYYDVTPDAIVVRESIDNSAEIRASQASLVCVDVCAHPEAWSAAGDRLAWWIPGYPRHLSITQRLGIRPLFGGTSAFTSAVALARTWGASRIVLVGAGFGMEEVDGELRSYHPAAPRGALRGRLDGGEVEFSGNEENDALCEASGQRPQPKRCSIVWLPAHDYATALPALDTLADERTWLEIEAGRHGERVELMNATEGGAGVVGWRNTRLVDVPIHEGEPVQLAGYAPVGEREQAALVDNLRGEARTLGELSSALLAPQGPRLDAAARTPGAVMGAPLVECLAAWRLVDAPQDDPLRRCRYTHEALREAASEAMGILQGSAP